jgi:hypothetical protein
MRTSGSARGRRCVVRAAAVLLSVVCAVGFGAAASTVAHAAEGYSGRASSWIDLGLLIRIADSGHK